MGTQSVFMGKEAKAAWLAESHDASGTYPKHLMRHDYLDLGGIVVVFEQPAIRSTLWYDDETEEPEVCFESFRNYNLHSLDDYDFEWWRSERRNMEEGGCCSGAAVSNPFLSIWKGEGRPRFRSNYRDAADFTADPKNKLEARPLSDEEIGLIGQACKEQRARFESRLQTYWKRYSKKVRASGYWANR